MSFSSRSPLKELLDADNIPFADIKQNMKELNFINTYLGGHSITISGFKKLAAGKKQVSVCEIGCGGGDNLIAIQNYALKKGVNVNLIGIDLKEECIAYARTSGRLPASAELFVSDYRSVNFQEKPDIIFSSLFCHHFNEGELQEQFAWMSKNSRLGFFVNDLQRHPLAYYSIKGLTALFSSSYLVKHDAPLSVLRGFKKNELLRLCKNAQTLPVHLKWRWAFRYLLWYKHAA
ncbi:methyltransferase domain-containing protein [Aridibaculum aurantiacum]|uniref:methyltransferase domain-containing protein n=1 Tax=Aridibaculum aurantiacum TaxID=2810307 RepID=UPI001A97363B|nr:methyltransferase domain-containing protein [Aridibaculum aurantiacum]